MNNKFVNMARELLAVSEDAENRIQQRSAGKKVSIDDFDLCAFVQTWGSTALGFGGIGGCTLTSARTFVFVPYDPNEMALVYFGSGFAYKAPWSESFMSDVEAHSMEPVYRKGKYFVQAQKEVEEGCQK